MVSKNIRINNGPSFKGFISTLAGFFIIICVIATTVILAKGEVDNPGQVLLFAILTLPVAFALFLVVTGVEFDLVNHRVRGFRNYYIIRIGVWQDLKNYDSIILERERFKSNGKTPTGRIRNTYFSYNILLNHASNPTVFVVKECSEYEEAKALLTKLGDALKLKTRDIEAEAISQMKTRKRRR